MARKRLRPFLDEVISDVDLRTSVERVAGLPPADPTLTVVTPDDEDASSPPPGAFPAPPWENPPTLTALPGDDESRPA